MVNTPPPPTTNPAISVANDIENIVFGAAVAAASAILKLEVPFLALPGISGILDLALGYFSGLLQKQLATIVAFTIIDFQTDSENQAYQNAVNALVAAHTSGDPNAIAQARTNFSTTLGALVHWDGS